MMRSYKSVRRALLKMSFALLVLLAPVSTWANSPTLVPQPTIPAPASIPELARALKYDVNLIYEYVYTNVDYIPTYGLKKGALGTLLDGQGNDIDQSALLVALLREAGYTANYVYSVSRLTPAQAGNLFGTVDPCPLANLLSVGGIPSTVVASPNTCAGTLQFVDVDHMWVSVTGKSLGSTTYYLDPAVKTYNVATGIDLKSAINYDGASFLSAAKTGSTSTSNSIQNLNSANIQTALTGYANNLVAYIRAQMPTATTREIIGGRYIQSLTRPYALPTALPNLAVCPPSPCYPPPTTVTSDDDLRSYVGTTLRLQIGGIDKTYYGDQIYGHRLSVVYDSSARPTLYLDGTAQGSPGTAGATALTFTVDFPLCIIPSGTTGPNCPIGFTDIYSTQRTLQAGDGFTFAIVAAWDVAGRGLVEFHRQQLATALASGQSATSESVLGESLNVIGYAFLAQYSAWTAINDQMMSTRSTYPCLLGVVGQAFAPYIDLGGLAAIANLNGDLLKEFASAWSSTGAGSASEWGTLDQALSTIGNGAVSTVKLFDIANSGHVIIYDATSANWSAIQPLLSGYSTSDASDIQNAITSGKRVILPQQGNLTQGNWTGAGYITADASSAAYIISHQLKGSFSTDYVPAAEAGYIGTGGYYRFYLNPGVGQQLSIDPIDLTSGAFLYSHSDIATGSTGLPVGLAFERSYNSDFLRTVGPLGAGWSHNFAITATASSDGLLGLGRLSPIDGAASIAAAYVALDLFSDPAKPLDKMVIATLVQKWQMDRLINNVVMVQSGSQAEQFRLLADGSYNPQPGSTNRLSLSGGAYTLTHKDGTTLAFNSSGNITSWQNTAGNTVSFSYDSSSPPLLTSVSNSFGRSFTLSYNPSKQLTAVTDNSSPSRVVTYAYDATGNLSGFTDTLGNQTTYAYTPAGGTAPAGLLSQIFYPSNPGMPFVTNTYDSLGRVKTQTNANGGTWQFFFAGYRSEEDDPYGTQHVLYYNTFSQALFDIQDAAGLGLLSAFSYDGRARLTATVLPEGGGSSFEYDGSANSWANNIAKIHRNPKPGSGLLPSTTSYTYEPTFNKPTSITEPPTTANPAGMVTTFNYDAVTGNLLSMTADAGAAPAHLNARTTYTYNTQGLVAAQTDAASAVTRYTYDGLGNLIAVAADAGGLNQLTSYGYSSLGDVISVTDPRGNVTANAYDSERRLTSTTTPPTSAAPRGLLSTLTYDADSRPLQVQQCINPATGPPCSPGSVLRSVSATYTATGQQATATDPNGNVSRYVYDLLDRLTKTTDPAQRTTTYSYDVVSRPTALSNPGIQASPLVQQAYTADSLPLSVTDARGNTTTFGYDGFDRLSSIAYPIPSGGTATTETFTYDAADNLLIRKTRASCTIGFVYDTLNRLVTKTIAVQPAPCVGSPASTLTTTYSYDLLSRLTGVSDNGPAIAAAVPPSGNRVSYSVNYTYNALDQPTNISWPPQTAPSTALTPFSVTFQHSYNAVNRRIGQSVSDNTWINYPPGVPSTTNYTSNALNQYTAVGAASLGYDTNGNLTSDGTFSFGYDPENRLTSASGAGNTAAYAYNGLGLRKSRTVNGTTTLSVTDADGREVLEYSGATGQLLRWYAYDLGPNGLVSQTTVATGSVSGFITDLLGSVIGVADTAAGTLIKSSYQAFGQSNDPPAQFGYTGQRFDPETGLYFYRARHYSPLLGRFLESDPIGYGGGLNLYSYAGNDPLNVYDPYGLTSTPLANAQLRPFEAAQQAVINQALEATHIGLTALSFCPSVCGSIFALADAAVYVAQGQHLQAGISAGAALAGALGAAGVVKLAAVGTIAAADALKVAAGAAKGAQSSARTAVTAYEVGTYTALSRRSVGDQFAIHHVVQAHPGSQILAGYGRAEAPAIALSTAEHKLIRNLRGPYEGSARDLLARDIRNLRDVTEAPNSALQRLIELNKSMYPNAFTR